MTLSYLNRPKEVQDKIINSFNKRSADTTSKWPTFNGAHTYNICGINEFSLLKTIIYKNSLQKEFYFMDIGAGNFQLNRELAKRINEEASNNVLFQNIRVHIFGLRAEKNEEVEIYEEGLCKLYNLGNFPVENISEAFIQRGLGNIKFDFIVSSFCFNALVDPVGTMLQVYDMMSIQPSSGYFLVDGFKFLIAEQTADMRQYLNNNLHNLFEITKDPYISCKSHTITKRPDSFLLKKTYKHIDLPLKYSASTTNDLKALIFDVEKEYNFATYKSPESDNYIMGDRALYNFLSENEIFGSIYKGSADESSAFMLNGINFEFVGPVEVEDSHITYDILSSVEGEALVEEIKEGLHNEIIAN